MTNSGFHSEEWSPSWNIGAILIGFVSIMTSDKDNGIAHIKQSPAERKLLAEGSIDFNNKNYPEIISKFKRLLPT